MFEWRFDRTFRITVTHDDHCTCVRVIGDLDAVTAKNLEQRADLPSLTGEQVVLDLSELETIDMAGVRQIRRIESLCGRCETRGARHDVSELLDLIPGGDRPIG